MNLKTLFIIITLPFLGNLQAQDTIPYQDFDNITQKVSE